MEIITGLISIKLGTKHPWVNEIQICTDKEHRPFIRADDNEIAKIF